MLDSKFQVLVSELESAGAVGHQAYELANQVDSAFVNYATNEQIKEIATEIMHEEAILEEALENTNV